MKKRLLIALGVGLLILIVGSALYRYRPQSLYSSLPEPNEAKNLELWHAQDIPIWTLVRGQELVYDLDYSGSGLFPGKQDRALEFRLLGTLNLIVLAEEVDHYRVWLHIESEGSSLLNQIPLPIKQSLQKTWTEGIGARMSLRGFHVEPSPPPDLDPAAGQFWQRLMERLQVDLPVVLSHPKWDQNEKMAGGILSAHYEVDRSQSTKALQNEKIYLHKSFDGSPKSQLKLSGESLILLQPRFDGLDQVEAQSREVQEFQGQSWISDSLLKVRWQRQNQIDETRLAAIEAHWGKTRGTKTSSQETTIQKVALGTMGLDELWALMNHPGDKISQDLYLKLKAWVYLNPSQMKLLMDRLKTLNEGDPLLNLGIRALAAAGHPEAQDALVDLLNQRKTDVPLAKKIITTLGLIPEPSLHAQQTLERMGQSAEDSAVRRSSRLALGIMGQRLSQNQDPAAQKRAEDIEAIALQNLRKASGLSAITEALAVLGNCGVSRIEDLDHWLKDPDPAIRGPAFFALRFARPTGTPLFLVENYSKDSSADVRKHIMQAISLRVPDLPWFGAMDELLAQTLPDEDKIIIAKALLRSVKSFRDESLKIMTQLLQQTQDATVRETLAGYQTTARQQAQF